MTEEANPLRRSRIRMLLIFLVLILVLVWAFRAVLMPFLVALFFAYLIDPLVERMAAWRIGGRFSIGRAGSIVLIYLVLISLFTVGFIYAIPAVGRQVRELQEDLPKAMEWADARIADAQEKWDVLVGNDPEAPDAADTPVGPGLARFTYKNGDEVRGRLLAETEEDYWVRLGDRALTIRAEELEQVSRLDAGSHDGFRTLAQRGADLLQHNLNSVLGFAVGFARRLVSIFTHLVLIMMITAFIIIDRERIVAFLHRLPPSHYQGKAELLREYLDRGLAGVIRGQLLICLVNGVLTWIGLQMFGVRYAALLGLIAGIFSLIPVFGTVLSTIPIVLIAWGAGDLKTGMLALGWILLIHFVEANFLNPKIMGGASKIHPVVIFFALLAGEHAYGVVGALLAVPTASLLQSAFQFFVLDRQAETEAQAAAEPA
ncbi:MAG: AI-2E family transporter [Planctomycetota bacterium]|jgi:predicted PurR-regulated permease PerM